MYPLVQWMRFIVYLSSAGIVITALLKYTMNMKVNVYLSSAVIIIIALL